MTTQSESQDLNQSSPPIPIPIPIPIPKSQPQSQPQSQNPPESISPSRPTIATSSQCGQTIETLDSPPFSPSKPSSKSAHQSKSSSPSHSRSTSFQGSTSRPRARAPSISLTLLKAPPNTPIGPSHSINPFSDRTQSQTAEKKDGSSPSRLAFSFSSPKPSNSWNHHHEESQISLLPLTSLQHQQILLPFLDRPKEIYDLLFNNPKTSVLAKRISSTLQSPDSSGREKKNDFEKFKELVKTPRAHDSSVDAQDDLECLDDLELLSKLKELVESKDKDLWARLKSCLGADGLLEEYEWQIQHKDKLPNMNQIYSDHSFNDSAVDDDDEDDEEVLAGKDLSNAATIASSSSASSLSSSADSSYDGIHLMENKKVGEDYNSNDPHSMDQILSSHFNLEPFSVQLQPSGRSRGSSQEFDLSPSYTHSSLESLSRNDQSGSAEREISPFGTSSRRASTVVDFDRGQVEREEAQVDIEPLKELPSSFGRSLPSLVSSSERQAQELSAALDTDAEGDDASKSLDGSPRNDVDIPQPSSDTLGHGFVPIHAGGSHGGFAHVRSRSLSSGSSAGSMGGLTLSKILEEEELGKKASDTLSTLTSQIQEKGNQKEEKEQVEHLSEPKRFAGLRISTTCSSPPVHRSSPFAATSQEISDTFSSPSHKSSIRGFGAKKADSPSPTSRSLPAKIDTSALTSDQTQLPGDIKFTKSRRLSGLLNEVDFPKPQFRHKPRSHSVIFQTQSSSGSEGSPTPQPRGKGSRSRSMSYGPSVPNKGLEDELGEIVPSSRGRKNSFVRSYAALSPGSPVQTFKDSTSPSRRHTRSASEKGSSSQSTRAHELGPLIESLGGRDSSTKSQEGFKLSSHGALTPGRARRVTFGAMDTSSGDLIYRDSPPSISPLSSLKPLSPLGRTKGLSPTSHARLGQGSALTSSSSNSSISLADLAAAAEVSEYSSEENENEAHLKARKKDISARLDVLEIENKLKLGLMKDGRTRHPSASRSTDVRKRSKSLNYSADDLHLETRKEKAIQSGKVGVLDGGDGERVRGRRVTIGHNDSEQIKIAAEEVEKFRREFGIRSSSGIKSPVEHVLSEEAFIDSNIDTHMPSGMPLDSSDQEPVDPCLCQTEIPKCSTHGSFSPSKTRSRKRSSSLLSQELAKTSPSLEEKRAGPSELEHKRDSSRHLESEIKEKRNQFEALSSGESLNEFEKEMQMAQAHSPQCQTIQNEEALQTKGNDIHIPPGLPFTPSSPPTRHPRRRSSLSQSADENEIADGLGLSGVPTSFSASMLSPPFSSSHVSKAAQQAISASQNLKPGFHLQMPPSRPSSDTAQISPPTFSRPHSMISSERSSHRRAPSEELRTRYRAPSDATDSSHGSGNSSYDYGLMGSPQSSAGIPSPESGRKSFADIWTSPRLQVLTQKAQAHAHAQQSDDQTAHAEAEGKIQISPSFGTKTGPGPGPQDFSFSSLSSKALSTIVFPVPPKASRSSFISNRLSSEDGASSSSSSPDSPHQIKKKALETIRETIGEETWSNLKKILTEKERDQVDDRTLLEIVGKGFNLVDHSTTSSSSSDLQKLAEESYEKRWQAFTKLCAILGVSKKDLMEAKKRAGPVGTLSVQSI